MRSSRACRASLRPSREIYDALVIGAGHNGLVAAAYLARAGKRVLVVERRHCVGGAAVTEEIFPGFKFSRASYVYSLFRPQIVHDLVLNRHGLKLLPRIPSSWTPPPPGSKTEGLLLGNAPEVDIANIARLSQRDAEAWPKFNALLDRYAEALRPLLDLAPPDPAVLSQMPASTSHVWDWIDNARDAAVTSKHLAKLGSELPGFLVCTWKWRRCATSRPGESFTLRRVF
jgi:phytoene dehydrogenase-like protein